MKNSTTINSEAISPPSYTYQKKLSHIFESDSDITVSDLIKIDNNSYKIIVTVNDDERAYAIQSLLVNNIELNNIKIIVDVLNKDGNIPSHIDVPIEKLAELTFIKNSLFCKIVYDQDNPIFADSIYCVFVKDIIQFKNSDINDYDGNFTNLVSKVLEEICVTHIQNKGIYYCTKSNRDTDSL